MVGRGRGKNLRRGGGGGRGLPIENESVIDWTISDQVSPTLLNGDVGSNTHSPIEEELNGNIIDSPSKDQQGGRKRNYISKFDSRLDVVLSVNEAADPSPNVITPRGDNDQEKKMRTKYMHANKQRIQSQTNDGNSSQASATSSKKVKGERGKYRSLVIEKKTLGGKCKLDVEIPDYVCQAVGDNSRNLVNYCDYVVRTTALMNAKEWNYMASTYGPTMWEQVKNKFNIKDSQCELPRLQAFVMYAMQRLYRYWKCRLHSYYKECGTTHEELVNNPPADFPIENWKLCCETFDSDDLKKKSERNKMNRSSDKWCQHTTGNLSFPEVEVILAKKNNNEKPTADVIWIVEHTRMNDKGVLEWVDDKRSKKVHSDLHKLVQNKDKEGAPQTQEEMLVQVLGVMSGYIRGKGSGYGGSIKARIHEEQQHKIREQQDKIQQLESQLEEHKASQQRDMKAMDESQQRYMKVMEEHPMKAMSARSGT